MNFVSTSFLFYLIFVFLGNWFLRKKLTLKNIFLLVTSYIFYATFDLRFLIILVTVSLLSYQLGSRIGSSNKGNKILLTLGLILNLGTLTVFKYYEFFRSSVQNLLQVFHINTFLPLIHVILPVGLSFYLFRTMSYLIDNYRGEIKDKYSVLEFMLYVAYFPQLLSGPIMRFNVFLQEIRRELTSERVDINRAVVSILSGLFKKVVLASYLSTLLVDDVFAVPINHSTLEVLTAVFGYTMQIYMDFSGYTDLANGVSLILGIEPPLNFKQPYISLSPSEFWRRWHITLSQWLRDYLYIPLGGNRVNKLKKYFNLMLTMVLGGLWHGASWQFVMWGGIHGIALVVDHLVRDLGCYLKVKMQKRKLKYDSKNISFVTYYCAKSSAKIFDFALISFSLKMLRWFFTFNFVAFAWIFFRASTLQNALEMIKGLFRFHLQGQGIAVFGLIVLTVSFVLHFCGRYTKQIFSNILERSPLVVKILIVTIGCIIILEVGPEIVPPFIYFRF